MKRIFAIALVVMISTIGCTTQQFMDTVGAVMNEGGQITDQEIGFGLKEALTKGITTGVNLTSKTDGFFKNPRIKIPWPQDVVKVENTLRDIGLGGEVDKVVLSLNRAAEDAAKQAKPIFVDAIKSLTFSDVMSILKGEEDAATQFLQRTTSSKLTAAFNPVIGNSLNKVDATKHWGDVIGTYNKVPFVQKVNPDLKGYVTGQALDGLFTMVRDEEQKIRKNPLARTTDLLKKVFALQD